MLFPSKIVAGLVVLFSLAEVASAGDPPESRTIPFDVVEMIAGRDIPGKASASIDYCSFRYSFSTTENRNAFLNDPAKYSVQLGGACGKMGPLSGTGNPNIHAVHDGKLYFFASESCRESFLKDPAARLDPPDVSLSEPAGKESTARHLVEEMVEKMQSTGDISRLSSYRLALQENKELGGKAYNHVESWTVRFPEDMRHSDAWNDNGWVYCWSGGPNGSGAAWPHSKKDVLDLDPQQRVAMEKIFFRHPLFIAKAVARKDFVAVFRDFGELANRNVVLVDVWFGGVTTTLYIDSNSRKLVATRYRGRGPSGAFGEVLLVFGDEKEVAGLRVPFTSEAYFEGERVRELDLNLSVVEIDPTIDGGAFEKPRS